MALSMPHRSHVPVAPQPSSCARRNRRPAGSKQPQARAARGSPMQGKEAAGAGCKYAAPASVSKNLPTWPVSFAATRAGPWVNAIRQPASDAITIGARLRPIVPLLPGLHVGTNG
jgi:hypothetical protein